MKCGMCDKRTAIVDAQRIGGHWFHRSCFKEFERRLGVILHRKIKHDGWTFDQAFEYAFQRLKAEYGQ